MAISLAGHRRKGQKSTTAKRLAREYGEQEKRAQKRKGISGLLGKGLGMGITAGLVGLTGLTGGLAAPLLGAAGSWLGKKGAHEMTRGMGAKTGGLKGDIYGYGEEEAMSLKKDLESQMAVDPSKEQGGFGKELLSSYVSAGMAGELGGAKQYLKGDITGKEALLGTKDWKWGGAKGAKESVGELFGTAWGEGGDKSSMIETSQADTPLTSEELSQSQIIPGSSGAMETLETSDPTSTYQPSLEEDVLTARGENRVNVLDILQAQEQPVQVNAQGGQVMNQQQLMALLALSEMQQNNAYSGTPLEETKQPSSIAEMFESKGKTLDGNNTQSLSQMLGR